MQIKAIASKFKAVIILDRMVSRASTTAYRGFADSPSACNPWAGG
jgi:hypothetical protein